MRAICHLVVATAFAAVLVGAAGEAAATDRHERVSITAVKQKGKTVGFKVKLTLRPESYGKVRIGLGANGKLPAKYSGDKRDLAAGGKKGYIRLKLGELSQLTANQPKEVGYTVTYGKGNTLKPGDLVDVVTAWTRDNSYWHVWGMKNGPVTSGEAHTLPK